MKQKNLLEGEINKGVGIMFEHYCSSCKKYYSDFKEIDYYSEYIDASLLEYVVVKCPVCETEYEVLLNGSE